MMVRNIYWLVIILLYPYKIIAQDKQSLIDAYRDSAKHYESQNKNLQAYNLTKKARDLMLSAASAAPDKLARAESDLGTYAYRMGNISLAQTHHRGALRLAQSLRTPNYECLYLSCNNMGNIMWFASKMDSALYYFSIAIDAVAKMDSTPQNKYYRPAVLHNNLAGIYGVQGKTTEGIAAMKKTISYLKLFLAMPDPSLRKDNALHFQFEATDNLAGIYKELGNYRKAHDLLMHSYHQKQKTLGATDPDVYKSEVLLGQLFYAMKEFAKAAQWLLKGIKAFDSADGDFLFWKADAYSTLALVAGDTQQPGLARMYFERADSLYEASLNGEYDNIYLQFLREASIFYAKDGSSNIALKKALKGYKYIASTEGEQSLSGFYQMLNLAEVQFQLTNYPDALRYSRKALNTLSMLMNGRKDMLDSIKMELKKPRAILLQSRAEYELLKQKNPETLIPILHRLGEAHGIAMRRREILQDVNDINLLMADHQELISFMKKILSELHALTGKFAYMEELVNLHEMSMYNRIRSRLNQNTDIRFLGVPGNILDTERTLRRHVNTAIDAPGDHDQKMARYLQAEEEWKQFVVMLREKYPQYYTMRYGSRVVSISDISRSIPEGTTAIRYIFAGNELLALVADKQQQKLFHLKADGLHQNVALLQQYTSNPVETGGLLLDLYNQLWLPLKKAIRHKRVVIIPDGVLFNINFEVLSPVKIRRFGELATNSILSEYTVSYNYSLLLLNQKKQQTFRNNFVAFTPGFFNNTKILPQPFTVDLAKRTADRFGGNTFTGEQSTVSAFREHANGHRVIHIGTHAEADNLHPQYSRLIFSKDGQTDTAENNLYLFDIYNCNLQTNLAVITACESGKVGYKDGEGLVSLAHAFNYAGSESMLTGLSKIDEKSCADIMQSFYDNLSEGMPKDEALKKAKLLYLHTTNGRALSPQYWAGLVIMGDTSPVVFKTQFRSFWWIGGMAVGTCILLWLLNKKAASRRKTARGAGA